jgi:uncharacterized protein YndB with AHSA1/START domain
MTDNDQDYTAALNLRGSIEVAFDALTTTDGLAAWWTEVSGTGTRGGELRFTFGSDASAVTMRVDGAERGRVEWTCLDCHVSDWVDTSLSFGLTARSDGGCDLEFRHRGLTPKLECYLDCKSGWDHFIPSLQAFIDTGVGRPRGSEADQARRELRAERPVRAE